jgi:ABC-type Fe3+/spermidine/putrescine transport system ATPase subunit
MTETGLVVRGIHKGYGNTAVLKGISLEVPQNAFHVLLGPSGSGKTTLLRIIAGFTPADAGTVVLGGRDITHMPPERRNIGVVFQNYALFPHMTVAQNIAFGLKMRSVARDERAGRVADILALVRMQGFAHRYPGALSGGQQQRVALARALVIEPQFLLLDEPLSALDRKIRQEVREELKRIQEETRISTIMVTHDQEEALYLADRMLLLEAGQLRQEGPPAQVYHDPADEFVAGFLGPVNLVEATVIRRMDGLVLRIGTQEITPPPRVSKAIETAGLAGPARLAIRPEQLIAELARSGTRPPDALVGRIAAVGFGGAVVVLKIEVEGRPMTILALSPDIIACNEWQVGRPIWIRIKEARLLTLAACG